MGGEVIDPEADRPGVLAMREVNDRIAADDRVFAAMIGVADGITLALKRDGARDSSAGSTWSSPA